MSYGGAGAGSLSAVVSPSSARGPGWCWQHIWQVSRVRDGGQHQGCGPKSEEATGDEKKEVTPTEGEEEEKESIYDRFGRLIGRK